MLFDTHAHLNFHDYKNDADEVIERSLAGGTWLLMPSSEIKTSRRAVDSANKYAEGVYAAIGLHPIHLQNLLAENHDDNGDYKFETKAQDFSYQEYYDLAKSSDKVRAIGEIGLDYYHLDKDGDILALKNKQQEVLRQQLKLSADLKLPAIIHCREAHDDIYPILQETREKYYLSTDRPWAVMHCFSGDLAQAQKYFDLGLLISFTGLITFNHSWDDLIRAVPLDKIMIETDSPYMSPIPYRGQRNEPLYVEEVAKKIADLKNLPLEVVKQTIFATSRKFFNI